MQWRGALGTAGYMSRMSSVFYMARIVYTGARHMVEETPLQVVRRLP